MAEKNTRENQKLNLKERDFEKRDKRKKEEHSLTLPILGVFSLLFSIILLVAEFGNAGEIGGAIFNFFMEIFGWPSYFMFIIFLFISYYLWYEKKPEFKISFYFAFVILLISLMSITYSFNLPMHGLIGENFAKTLEVGFGKVLGIIISIFISIVCIIMIAGEKPNLNILKNKFSNKEEAELGDEDFTEKNLFVKVWNFIKNIFSKIKGWIMNYIFVDEENENDNKKIVVRNFSGEEETFDEEELKRENDLHNELLKNFKGSESEEEVSAEEAEKNELRAAKNKSETERKESVKIESKPIVIEEKFMAPSLSILSSDSGKSSAGDSKFKMNAIQKTLDQFGIPVEMGEVTVGPSVTQFTLKPAQGVNVKKILSLKDNLQMALSATNMHIEAPIPGKPFVGIEIPNEKKSTLGLRSLLEISEFQDAPALSLAIGKSIIGKPIISDLGKMPHLLVAGATGTGKSVTLHNLILSLLYKNSPYDLKLIILDPKRVEFTAYNSLPHLYTPIIKDPKNAIKSLNWAAQEMDRRYDVLGEYGVANLNDYNKKILFPALEKAKKKFENGDMVEGLPPKMPFIVIVFDEYNDFMLSYPKEITPIITSLTQKARAAGIHLILATQRPDVKVITGTIKANIPARIALKTTSSIDSRTILDQQGAEDLLGNGDMLYMNGSNIIRVQAPFVSTEEIRDVIKDIKTKYDDFVPDEINLEKIKVSQSAGAGYREMNESENRDPSEEPTDDEDYMSARDYVISTGKASTSSLQTAFRWGYNKAARIINDLESYGVISPAINGRNREVLFGKSNSDIVNENKKIEDFDEDLEDNMGEENNIK